MVEIENRSKPLKALVPEGGVERAMVNLGAPQSMS